MDELVLRGIAKWPNTPAVYGWLELDRRGNWLIKGERIGNDAITSFIDRNYGHDETGRWFFQNGPQRVYVHMHYTPFVYRARNPASQPLLLQTHTGGRVTRVEAAYLDEFGGMLIVTEHGPGVIDDRDMQLVACALCDECGITVGEERIDELMSCLLAGADDSALYLKYEERLSRIRPVLRDRVAQCFHFCPRPQPSSDVRP